MVRDLEVMLLDREEVLLVFEDMLPDRDGARLDFEDMLLERDGVRLDLEDMLLAFWALLIFFFAAVFCLVVAILFFLLNSLGCSFNPLEILKYLFFVTPYVPATGTGSLCISCSGTPAAGWLLIAPLAQFTYHRAILHYVHLISISKNQDLSSPPGPAQGA
jgi:hypothetical protein